MQIKHNKPGGLRRPLAFWLLWTTISVAIWLGCALAMLRIADDSVLNLSVSSETYMWLIIACLAVSMTGPAVVYQIMKALWEKTL